MADDEKPVEDEATAAQDEEQAQTASDETSPDPSVNADADADATAEDPKTESADDAETEASPAKAPEFSEMPEHRSKRNGSLDRFYDVNIPIWAELGRVEMPIGELMQLDAGSVLRLNRPISDPVEIVSQGVTLARGEVVVVDDYFAIRIKEIADSD